MSVVSNTWLLSTTHFSTNSNANPPRPQTTVDLVTFPLFRWIDLRFVWVVNEGGNKNLFFFLKLFDLFFGEWLSMRSYYVI